jgi:hypothetical protein
MPDSPRAHGPTPDPTPERRAGEGAPFSDAASLLDVLDRVLERGIVMEPSALGALPALDLAAGEASVTIASTEGVPDPGAGWAALADVVAAAAAERAVAQRTTTDRAPGAPGESGGDAVWRSGEHAALKRQFERLNA